MLNLTITLWLVA